MIRNVDLSEISDGKLYELNDMVKADCGGCKDCSACCRGMGTSIILDPLDINRLSINLSMNFETLLADKIELHVVDGIILPNLSMVGESERCAFLDEDGRCSIHTFRPGICRLFPLGRYYENNSFKYFLQVKECQRNKTKIKVYKWIDTPDLKKYEQYIIDWHYFLKEVQAKIQLLAEDALIKNMNIDILRNFYIKPYDRTLDFYLQFYERLKKAKYILLS